MTPSTNTTDADIRKNNKVHTVYKNDAGKRLPSVTTILDYVQIGSKPQSLKIWAYNLGRKGIDMDGYVDELAGIGTLAHRMILDHLRGDKTDTSFYAPQQVDLAENCFLKYLEWERCHKVEPLIVETPLTDDLLGYGGTPDFFGKVDGAFTLIDFKTGKAIYEDYWYQLGGYDQLLCGKVLVDEWPKSFRILNIGRSNDEQFVEETRTSLADEIKIFLSALAIYQLKHKGKSGK